MRADFSSREAEMFQTLSVHEHLTSQVTEQRFVSSVLVISCADNWSSHEADIFQILYNSGAEFFKIYFQVLSTSLSRDFSSHVTGEHGSQTLFGRFCFVVVVVVVVAVGVRVSDRR